MLALCVFTAEIIKVVRAGLDKEPNEPCVGLKADAHMRALTQRKGFAKSWLVLPFVAFLKCSCTRVRVRGGLRTEELEVACQTDHPGSLTQVLGSRSPPIPLSAQTHARAGELNAKLILDQGQIYCSLSLCILRSSAPLRSEIKLSCRHQSRVFRLLVAAQVVAPFR